MDKLRKIQKQQIINEVEKAIDDEEIMIIAHGHEKLSLIAVGRYDFETLNMLLSAVMYAVKGTSSTDVDEEGLYRDLKNVVSKYWSGPNE